MTKELTEKEKILLEHLRQNSRKSLTRISKETSIPVSTLFETLKRIENNCMTNHVSLVNFSRRGDVFKINFSLAASDKNSKISRSSE